jgi:hypothetical protein
LVEPRGWVIIVGEPTIVSEALELIDQPTALVRATLYSPALVGCAEIYDVTAVGRPLNVYAIEAPLISEITQAGSLNCKGGGRILGDREALRLLSDLRRAALGAHYAGD